MMTGIIRILAFLVLIGCSPMLLSADNERSANELSAIEAVNNYLGAMMIGDTAQATLFLSPAIADQRRALFSNPTYSTQLQQAYENASHEIIASKMLSSDKVQVDVKVTLNQQDTVHSRFELKNINQQYLITSEK